MTMPCIVCGEQTTDTLLGQPKHLTREGCVAALRGTMKRKDAEDAALYDRVVACLHRHGQVGGMNVVDSLITYTDDVVAEYETTETALVKLVAWAGKVAFISDEGIEALGNARAHLPPSPAAPC